MDGEPIAAAYVETWLNSGAPHRGVAANRRRSTRRTATTATRVLAIEDYHD
jgi:hypothetical protein